MPVIVSITAIRQTLDGLLSQESALKGRLREIQRLLIQLDDLTDDVSKATLLALEVEEADLEDDLRQVEREIEESEAELAYQEHLNDIADRYQDMKSHRRY